jgi:hypothetical protein
MRLTSSYGEGGGVCTDDNCPAIRETDNPDLVVVQGAVLTDEEALSDAGSIPDHERLIVVPRSLIIGYASR